MNNKKLYFALLLPLSLTIFACKSNSEETPKDQDEPFKKSVKTTMELGEDYSDLSPSSNYKWEYDKTRWYINTLDKVPLPDPQVYVEDDTYYIVGTDDGSSCRYVTCYYTTDLISYEKQVIFNPGNFASTWEQKSNPLIYAPELYKVKDKYYLYYSAIEQSSGKRRNSVVWSDNVLGPYEPIKNDDVDGYKAPLFFDNEKGAVLDSTLFVDDDGEMYMYYSQSINGQSIYGVKLKSPYEADFSTKKYIVLPGTIDNNADPEDKVLEWEYAYRGEYGPIAEGPFMFKSKGKYYMTYSVNGCWNKYYNVCYAVSDSPLGTFTKPYKEGELWTNLLMGVPCTDDTSDPVYDQWSGFHSGTGHHCFFKIGDQMMIGYHAHKNRNYNQNSSGWVGRYFAMDPVYTKEDGTPFINGPTYSPQPLPEPLSDYSNIAPKAKIRVENVTNEKAINDLYVTDCYNLEDGSNEVKLGKGYSFIELTFDKEYTIGGLAINNSAYYDSYVKDLEYVAFSNGDAFGYSTFPYSCVNDVKEFVYPVSAFVFEIDKEIKANKVTICFRTEEPLRINEVQVLAY